MFAVLANKTAGLTALVVAIALVGMGLLPASENHARTVISGPASVIDGDTLVVNNVHIRLEGIDAPEAGQLCLYAGASWRCGSEATHALAQQTYGKELRCVPIGLDRYNRVLATCFADAQNINAEQVRSGHAVAYRQYSTEYIAFENAARSARLGIWRGEFIEPSAWRAANK